MLSNSNMQPFMAHFLSVISLPTMMSMTQSACYYGLKSGMQQTKSALKCKIKFENLHK